MGIPRVNIDVTGMSKCYPWVSFGYTEASKIVSNALNEEINGNVVKIIKFCT